MLLVLLDAFHLGDPLFVSQFARDVAARKEGLVFVHGSGEAVPFPDASFDVVFCDHGAMSFGDPYRTVPEVARLLRRPRARARRPARAEAGRARRPASRAADRARG